MTVTDVPKYEQVKRSLVKEIQAGRWSPGSPFPSESQLLQRYKVSRPTLIRSLQEMVRDGYLYREQGRGTFVADPVKKAGSEVIVMFISSLDAKVAEGECELPLPMLEFDLGGDASREVQLRIINGVQSGLGQAKHSMTVRQIDPATIDAATTWYLDQTPVGTALVFEPSFNAALIRDLQERGWNTWALNEPFTGCNSVYIDQEAAGYLATRYLLDKGCRRIAILNGPLESYWGFAARQRGYRRALEEAGITPEQTLARQGRHAIDSEAGRAMFRELLDADIKPDGVVGASDRKAMGAIAMAQEAGLSIPSDVRFVSIDNTLADRSDPPLSAVAMPFTQVGELAINEARRSRKVEARDVRIGIQVSLQPKLIER